MRVRPKRVRSIRPKRIRAMPKNLQIKMLKKQFILQNEDYCHDVEVTQLVDELDWEGYFDETHNFRENRKNLNNELREMLEGVGVLDGDFTLYPRGNYKSARDARNSQEKEQRRLARKLEDKKLRHEKGWRILKEGVVKTHRVKGYDYGSMVVSLPKKMVGHRVVLAVLDLTAKEKKLTQKEKVKQYFRDKEKREEQIYGS